MSYYRTVPQPLTRLKVSTLLLLTILLVTACRVEDETLQPTDDLAITSTIESLPTATLLPATPTIQAEQAPPTETSPAATDDASNQEASPTETMSPNTPTPTESPESRPASVIQLNPVATGLREPVYLTHAGDERLFIVEKQGTIKILQDGQLLQDPFLDITEKARSAGYEQGLLSVAFHQSQWRAASVRT